MLRAMPYSGAGDPGLPSNVKKLPATKRRQWVEVFNSVLRRGGNETSAFRQANGVVKEGPMDLEALAAKAGAQADFTALMEKCGVQSGMAVEVYRPLGGATSWLEADVIEQTQHMQHEASELMWNMRALLENIMDDPDLTPAGKAAALSSVADEFAVRAGTLGTEEKEVLQIPDDVDVEALDEDGQQELFTAAGVKEFQWKSRRYVESAADAPSGSNVQRGPRGGFFYETASPSRPARKPAKPGARPAAPASKPPGAGSAGNIQQLFTMLRSLIAKFGARPATPAPAARKEIEDAGQFIVTKDATGESRWLAVYSNKFYDRDGEVFPEKAHREFVAWVDRTKTFPELWLWHTPGSRVGKADWIDYSSTGFALASGTFDKGMEHVAEALANDSDLGVSHGFSYNSLDQDGVYQGYRSFEISPLPAGKAANPGTTFSAANKEALMLSPEKRSWLVEKMGDELKVRRLEAVMAAMEQEMVDKGISSKEAKDLLAEFLSGSPAADAAKSVPPNDSMATLPLPGNQLSLEAVKAAMVEALAPLAERITALETPVARSAPDFTSRVTPQAASRSVDGLQGAVSELALSDPLYAMSKEAEAVLAEAQRNSERAADKVPESVAWHVAALGHAALSATGVSA